MPSYHITAVLLHALSILTLARAAPTEVADLTPRSCAIEYPTITTIVKQEPDTPGYTVVQLNIWRDPSVVSPWRPIQNGLDIDSLLQFNNIPDDAWGCQLELFTPKGHYSLISDVGGSRRINVYRLTDAIVPGVTWNTAPKPAYLFGSAEVQVDQIVQEDTRIVINSLQCEPTLNFRVSFPPEVERGGLWGFQDETGFRLTYNC